jgi:hypothetical protein
MPALATLDFGLIRHLGALKLLSNMWAWAHSFIIEHLSPKDAEML